MFNRIDIHGYTISEAKVYLDQYLNSLSPLASEVTVIHGYQNGNTLLNYVRKQYRHKKIARVVLTMNHGETIFILKK